MLGQVQLEAVGQGQNARTGCADLVLQNWRTQRRSVRRRYGLFLYCPLYVVQQSSQPGCKGCDLRKKQPSVNSTTVERPDPACHTSRHKAHKIKQYPVTTWTNNNRHENFMFSFSDHPIQAFFFFFVMHVHFWGGFVFQTNHHLIPPFSQNGCFISRLFVSMTQVAREHIFSVKLFTRTKGASVHK